MKQKLYTFILMLFALALLFSCNGQLTDDGKGNEPSDGSVEGEVNGDAENGSENGSQNDNQSGNGNESGNGIQNGNQDDSENTENEGGGSESNDTVTAERIVFAKSGEMSTTYIVCSGDGELYELARHIKDAIWEKISVTLTAKPCEIYKYNSENDGAELIIGFTDRASANAAITEYTEELSGEFFCFIQHENDLIFYASSTAAYERGLEKFSDIFLTEDEFSLEIGYKYHEFLEN